MDLGRRRAHLRHEGRDDATDVVRRVLAPEYKDKIVVVDDPIGTYVHAAHIVGVDTGQLTEADLEKINDWLKPVLKEAKTVAATYGDAAGLLALGEAHFAWSGWAAMDSFAKDAGSDTVKTILPKEGGYSSRRCLGNAS